MAQTQIPPEQLAILAKEDLGPMTAALSITFTALALVCVILRFFTRIQATKLLGWEDYTIAVSMVFSIVTAVCQVAQVKLGVGRHAMFVPLPAVIQSLKWLFASILSYCVSLTLTKISILLQYRRIFAVTETRLPIYAVMAFCIAYGVECIFSGIFTCIPVDAFWNVLKKPTAKCINENDLYYANASLNIASDLLIAALPVRAIWRLHMVKKQKIALIMLLSLGWFICIVSMLRLHALIVTANHPSDKTYYSVGAVYWSAIEMNLAIVCASAPALKPLIAKLVPNLSSRRATDLSAGRSGTTKGSKVGNRSFQRLGEKQSLSTMKSSLQHDTNATELSPITPVPPLKHEAAVLGEIRVTHEVEHQSYSRPSNSSSQRLVAEAPQDAIIER